MNNNCIENIHNFNYFISIFWEKGLFIEDYYYIVGFIDFFRRSFLFFAISEYFK